ncbi:MAG: hypothetical protein QGH83_06155 [Candidatus Pacebacteria bacterium]|jgi:hypothetical protein|nr:hypothetical protein [Candidatus Paceibacterota bacterium]
MSRYAFESTLTDQQGHILSGGTCTVKLSGTDTAATIYEALTGGAKSDSIVTSGSDGVYKFFISDDDYAVSQKFRLVLEGGSGFTPRTIDDVLMFNFIGGPVEGTSVSSTGEAVTKYLRADGDGTSSWQTAPVTSVSGSTGAVSDGDIDHDSLANFTANEHFTQANITATGTVASGTWQGTAVDGTYVDLEGTELKSTGEAGGTKFLREDSDGTCSWQTAPVTSVSGSTGAVADGDIDHDSLANFAANEHYTQANITATGTVASGVWQGTAIDGTYIDLEGTEVKSTGEAGGTKYLKEDGDGTSSWQSAPAPEGTAVLSTGEAGGTKFLREDGDGSCSWQTGSGGGSYDSIGTNDILITKITIDENITFGGTDNGLSIGPLSIANGYTVSVVNGTRWLVL